MRTTKLGIVAIIVAVLGVAAGDALACTNILVTKGASVDGSTFISYSADSHALYGDLAVTPARSFGPGAFREIYEWDTGKYLGRIPQPAQTYSVVGLINEHQVSIGETTFTGRKELKGPSGIIDYGSLMFIGLERARTAREAIQVMTDLATEYGYASTGESISIADPNEVWILEMIGLGEKQKGAVWVARRIPDGFISSHANQSRIRQFPLSDPLNCVYSKNVISFAREKGWFSGKDADFSFADTYGPPDVESLRFCEARVWNVFRRAAPSLKLSSDIVKNVKGAAPLPLWIKPDKKLAVTDMMALMRDHFEGTEFDLSQGVGAGPYACPYRWRPMTWEVDGKRYLHERSISTQQTGFSFVSQMRGALPAPIGGIFWMGFDDTYMTVYTPMYCGIRVAPKTFATGVASLTKFSWDSAFWVFNWVSNYAYSRYSDMIVDIQLVQRELEGQFLADQPAIERTALGLYQQSPEQAREYLTRYSTTAGDGVTRRWRTLGEELLVKYMDGNVKNEKGEALHPAYPASWYREIVKERGEALRLPDAPKEP
jgi:dipeptidase